MASYDVASDMQYLPGHTSDLALMAAAMVVAESVSVVAMLKATTM